MEVSEQGGRNSGRTWRQLQAMPDGAVFLVHSPDMVRYCRMLLGRMGRRGNAVRFATPQDFHRLEGVRARVDIDHAYSSLASGTAALNAMDFVRQIAATQP